MPRFQSAVRLTLLVCAAIAPSCAQISPTNPGLKDWFNEYSWVSDIAGVQGTAGFNGNNIPALSALLDPTVFAYALAGVKTDRFGNVYFSDFGNNQIRMISAETGIVTVVAGSGNTACTDGTEVAPLEGNLYEPTGLAIDPQGNLYVSEFGNSRVRMISADRTLMTTLAGTCTSGYNGSVGGVNAATAELYGPDGIAVDSHGNVIFADTINARIRMISGGPYAATIYDIAGNGTDGYTGDMIPATSAELEFPVGVAVDLNDVIYVTDYYDQRIRMIVDGTIYTIVGNGTPGQSCTGVGSGYSNPNNCETEYPGGIAVNGYGDIVFADTGDDQLKLVSNGYLYPLVGSTSAGYTGTPSNGRNFWNPNLNGPGGVDIDSEGRVRFFDTGSYIIRLWRGESPVFVQTTNNTSAYEYFYQYDGGGNSYRYPGTLTLPVQRTLTVDGDPNQKLVGAGDFNRDGNLDLVWEDQVTHQVAIWYQSNAGQTGAYGAAGGGCPCTIGFQLVGLQGSSNWHVVAVADFNNDGVPDLVFQDPTTGQVVIWYMTGPWGNVPLGLAYVPGSNNSPWVVVGAADFNGDGTPDLLWQDPTTKQMLVSYMGSQGTTILSDTFLDQSPSGWNCIGTADFNGDGIPDIYYQNQTNQQVLVWLMTGANGATNGTAVALEFAPPSNYRYIAP
jgi:sugar lactone lactonase YvrE